jgi:hypothetical protein
MNFPTAQNPLKRLGSSTSPPPRPWLLPVILLLALVHIASAQQRSLTLQGSITRSQNQTYVRVPFRVPPGVSRLTVDFHYTTGSLNTRIDLGIFDPHGFRGASGGNKSNFTISRTDATPSYLPGPIDPGEWYLLLAVPNIRAGVVAHYSARVQFQMTAGLESFTDGALLTGTRWYRGDLHMHTGHSDGSCVSQSGKSVPCPVFVSAQTAVSRGLDFIAITDHNTVSQYNSERELQPYFDRLLFIPGREITTFHGHANVFGLTAFLDYRVGTPEVPNINTIAREVDRLGGIISINHPAVPTGEACLGCGWTPQPPADLHLFAAIEAVNGGSLRDPYPGLLFWEHALDQGDRITAIGGSDNHHGDWPISHPDSIGLPTTVVYASALSVPGILNGIRAGHVYIDLTGSKDRLLEMTARAPNSTAVAMMGDNVTVNANTTLSLTVHVAGSAGCTLKLLDNGHANAALAPRMLTSADATLHYSWPADGKRHWLLPQVVDATGALKLLGNPVYINYPALVIASPGG